MSRRRHNESDSLELLLDTICNTFGGIIFIAILVAILVQQVDEHSQPKASSAEMPKAELARRRMELSNLQAELQSLRLSQVSQEAVAATVAPREIQELLKNRDIARKARDQQQSKRDELLLKLSLQQATNQQTKEELVATRKTLMATREQVGELTNKIEREQAARRREIRTPITRQPSSPRELALILRYGRLYFWHKYGQSGERLGLNTDEFVIVKKDSNGIESAPIPSAGIILNQSPETRTNIANRLQKFSPQDFHVGVVVRPDSFEQFIYLRDALIEQGFEYRLLPMNDGDPVVDRGATDVRVQ